MDADHPTGLLLVPLLVTCGSSVDDLEKWILTTEPQVKSIG